MIFVLDQKITPEQFENAREVYRDYIKFVVDIERKVIAIGGEYHIDCEEALIQSGSNQEDLYGGGYRVGNKDIEFMALSNYKPSLGRVTYEISDESIREEVSKIVKEYL